MVYGDVFNHSPIAHPDSQDVYKRQSDISPEIEERMKALTVKAFHALKLNVYSRADFLLEMCIRDRILAVLLYQRFCSL